MRTVAILGLLLCGEGCGEGIPIAGIGAPPCRIVSRDGALYDTALATTCEVGKLNGARRCLPTGMWEERGAAWATPECDRLLDWSARDRTACLDGQSDFAVATWPHAGQPQTCGDLRGVVYRIRPTELVLQFDKVGGCSPFPFVLDLDVSRYSEFVPYPPAELTEQDFVDPAAEAGCEGS